MQFGKRAGDGEAQPRALVAAGHVALDLFERAADPIELVLGDADAGILDVDIERIAGLAQPDRDLATFGRELRCVVHEVADDLVERMRIGDQIQLDRPVDAEPDPLAVDLVARAAHGLLDDESDRNPGLLELQLAGLDARHVEDVVDHGEQVAAALADVAGIVEIAVIAEIAEQPVLHDLGEADDGVERRPQFVAHVGEELGFGAVGAFGRRLLLKIAFGHLRQFLRLRLQLLARGLEVGDMHHELVLRLRQPFLLLLQLGDVGADRDRAAILGAPPVDLEPASVREPRLIRGRADGAASGADRLAVDIGLGAQRHDLVMGDAATERLRRKLVQLLVFGVAEDEAVGRIPQHEGLRDRLDGVAQMGVCGRGALGHPALFGDVDRDADEMLRAGAPVDHQLGAGLEPDPCAIDVADTEFLVEMVGLAPADRVGERIEVGVVGIDEAGHLAEGHVVAGAVVAEHRIHGVRPVDPAARQIPVPEAAMAPVQRRVDALADAVAIVVGGAGPPRLNEKGERDRAEHDAGGGEQADQRAAPLLPGPEQTGRRLDDGDLAERGCEIAHGRQRFLAARHGQAHHAGLLAEGRQQLRRSQQIGQRLARGRARGGFAGDDVAGRGGDVDDAAMGGKTPGRQSGKHGGRTDLGQRSIVEFKRDQRGEDVQVSDGVLQDVVAHVRGLDDGPCAQDDDEERDENRDDFTECRFETFELPVDRVSQRSRHPQNRSRAHGCAARVRTRHARPPSENLYRQQDRETCRIPSNHFQLNPRESVCPALS
jgi:hypothetical protein